MMTRRSACGGDNFRHLNRWTYFSEGIAVNQRRVRRPLTALLIRRGIIGMTPNLVLGRTQGPIWSLTVLVTMMASQKPLPQRQSGGRTWWSKLRVRRRLVLGPHNGREIEVGSLTVLATMMASQKPLPQRQSGGRTG